MVFLARHMRVRDIGSNFKKETNPIERLLDGHYDCDVEQYGTSFKIICSTKGETQSRREECTFDIEEIELEKKDGFTLGLPVLKGETHNISKLVLKKVRCKRYGPTD